MIAISFLFTAGRYHATPWGRHVNEGVPEWPPSPWRILRALVATWKRTLPEVSDTAVGALLAKLTGTPSFRLPRATLAHTRHYVPWDKKGPGDRTLTFDTFVGVPRDHPVIAVWPEATLTADERDLLARVLDNLPYLGRSESWCKAILVEDVQRPNCLPVGAGEVWPEGCEPARVLATDAEPAALIDALLVDTGELRGREKRRDPTGSRWVTYARPRDCFMAEPARDTPRAGPVVQIVRYALDVKPLPLLTEAVTWAELARRASLARYGRLNGGGKSATLSGRDAKGKPLKDAGHACYLPADEDVDGRLDHLTIVAPRGFDALERQALASLDELNPGEGRPVARLLLLGMGASGDFAGKAPVFGPTSVWRSVTPFVLSRHPKYTRAGQQKCDQNGGQLDSPEAQVRREWEWRRALDPSLPAIATIEPEPACALSGRQVHWLDFRRWRSRGPAPALAMGFGFRLTFEAPVAGPLALGYGSHFGLGQFLGCSG